MKTTPFTAIHRSLGAKMVPFAGYEMPIQYEGILAEHAQVRESAGLFDVSHMGEFWVSGRDALALVEYATTNHVAALDVGQVQYSTMCLENGGIVDDLLVYRFQDSFMLVVNASNMAKDWAHLSSIAEKFDVELRDASEETALLALQGPRSQAILQPLVATDLGSLDFYHFLEIEVAGQPMILSRTGYTGELGYELYHQPEQSVRLWETLMDAGADDGLKPVGLGARDTLRMEMKFCLYGNDINETTHPLEARLAWVVNFDKGDFMGRDALLAAKSAGISRFLVAFEMLDRGLPRPGYALTVDGEVVGQVTSGGQSPTLKQGIGLAYVNKPYQKVGTELMLDVRGRTLKARVVKPPFVHKKTS